MHYYAKYDAQFTLEVWYWMAWRLGQYQRFANEAKVSYMKFDSVVLEGIYQLLCGTQCGYRGNRKAFSRARSKGRARYGRQRGNYNVDIVTLLTDQEGYMQLPYRDTRGKLTDHGIGRNLEAEGISLLEARYMLGQDLDRIAKKLSTLSFWKELGAVRQGVLISVALNCGVEGLLAFHHMLSDVSNGDFSVAAGDLESSKAAHRNCRIGTIN